MALLAVYNPGITAAQQLAIQVALNATASTGNNSAGGGLLQQGISGASGLVNSGINGFNNNVSGVYGGGQYADHITWPTSRC